MGVEVNNQDDMEQAPGGRRDFVQPKQRPRGYQLEVLDKALEENTIIFLETGCGKTLIAVLWIDALSHLIRKPSKKIAVFLVPNKALVEQQAKEVEENTNLMVGKFWGSMGDGYSWSYEWWQEQIVKYEVVVMTPQILFNNLHHCFFKMEMIELLVFDECHHAQKRHPYANIMRDFYHGKRHSLPKIFGLTASPVTGKAGGGFVSQKIDGHIHKLENMLDARLYTVKDRVELESLLPNPSQQIRKYLPSYGLEHVKYLIGLLEKLRDKYVNFNGNDFDMKMDKKEMDDVSKVYYKLYWCIYELGLWCTIEAAEILLNKEGLCLGDETVARGAKEAFLREALTMFKAADWTDKSVGEGVRGDDRVDIDETLLSPKLRCLVDTIKESREKYTKGIVFVDRVVATGAMSSILNRLKCLPFIKCLPLVGSQSMSHKSQHQAIEKFRSDEVNMLVATEIAEEGLDIQSCFMVIRFDGVPKTTRSFIQSRGRARQKGSTYIVLLESGNQDQYDDIIQLKEKEKLMWEFTENRGDMPTVLDEPEMFEVELFEVESTGAKVTTDYSVALLYRYCSRLPGDEFYQPKPDFSYTEDSAGIVCDIRLPVTAPFQQVTGHPCQTEKMARRVAALAACKRLYEVGALTDHLLPAAEDEDLDKVGNDNTNRRNLPTDPTAQMELHSTLVPDGFRGGWADASAQVSLFAFSLHIVAEPKDREYAEFALFLEAELDDHVKNSVTELYLTKGRRVKIRLVSHGRVEFDVDHLRDAKKFQERIFSITLDPKAERDSHQPSLPTLPNWDPGCLYLTLPLLPSTRGSVSVDWTSVRTVLTEIVPQSPPLVPSPGTDHAENGSSTPDHEGPSKDCTVFQMASGLVPLDAALNSLVETTHNARQYIVESVLWEMDCHSTFGFNPSQTHNSSQYRNYVDYYKKRYKVDILHPKQLLLKAKPLMKMHNLLVKRPQDKESGSASKSEMFVELPPELCCIKVLGFSSQVVNTVSLIPSFMHRIEYFLLATQLQKELEAAYSEAAKVSPKTVLQALTTDKCLESLSLERLELFGDSFLKFAVSKRLFLVHEKKQEGVLTKMRQAVICNSSLHRLGVSRKLTMYIHDELFNPQHWTAPGRPCRVQCDATNRAAVHAIQFAADASNPNQVKCSEGHRWLQKKAVADVVEAFIGAHLVDGGPAAALAFLEWVGINVHFEHDLIAEASSRCAGDIRYVQGKDLAELEGILRYQFKNKSLLVEALTHPSYQVPFGNCYQRLEFLGDAVLDYLITCHLFATFPDIDPGDLTDLRSATASNECFSRVAVRHHLEKFLLHENANLAEQVRKFVLFIQNVSCGKEHFYGWECDKGPKVLGDLVESLAGAVLVDTGFDTDQVWSIFEPLLQPIVTPDTLHLHPVRELVELCNMQKFKYECTFTVKGNLRLVKYTVNTGKDTIVSQAEKPDKKSAKRLAAYEMLEILKRQGFQHRYVVLSKSLISQGRMVPLGEAGNQGHELEELDSSSVRKPMSTFQASEANHTVSSTLEGIVFTAGKENLRFTENHADASNTLDNKLKETISPDGLKLPASTFLDCEALDDEHRNKSPPTLLEILEGKRKFETPGFPVPSKIGRHGHSSETMDDAELASTTPREIFLDDCRGGDDPHDNAASHLRLKSSTRLVLPETSSLASSDTPECPPACNIPTKGGREWEKLSSAVPKFDERFRGAPTDQQPFTETVQSDEVEYKGLQGKSLSRNFAFEGIEESKGLQGKSLSRNFAFEGIVEESKGLRGKSLTRNFAFQGINTKPPGQAYEAPSCTPSTYELPFQERNTEPPGQAYEAPSCTSSTYEPVTDEIITLETSPSNQPDSLPSNGPSDTSYLPDAALKDIHVDSVDVSNDVQLLIDALVRHPVHQNGTAAAGQAAAQEKPREEIHKGAAQTPDLVRGGSPKSEHKTEPSSTREETLPGWGSNANSFDANVGRPREDLHNLCAKYRWTMPSYEPCPDYPQGPPHAPRFAFLVKVSCSLLNNGYIGDYNVECEGEPMNNKSRAMDSAACCAMRWLEDNFKAGWTYAQGM